MSKITIPDRLLQFESAQDRHNFSALSERKRGQRFFIDRRGNLRKIEGFRKIWYALNKTYRINTQRNIQQTVTNLVQRLKPTVLQTTDENVRRLFFEHFFFKKLAPLSKQVFDRSSMDLIDQDLLTLLAPEYKIAREALGEYNISDALLTNSPVYSDFALYVAQFALKLGIAPKAASDGTSGTYFMHDLRNREIGVFKPKDEEVLGPNAPKTNQWKKLAAKVLPLFQTRAWCQGQNGYKAEVSAYKISNHLGLHNVPTTRIAQFAHPIFNYSADIDKVSYSLPDKEGSFQLYINTPFKRADQYLGHNPFWHIYKLFNLWPKKLHQKLDQQEFERFIILDYLIGNIDRHFANWVITKKKKIFAIDNAFAMAPKHSENMYGIHQYAWRILPQARQPFSDQSKLLANTIAAEKENLILNLKNNQLINSRQEQALRQRIDVLILFIREGRSPRELAKIRTSREFEIVLAS